MAKREKTWSLKEIDRSLDAQKGTAFRAFKQLQNGFDEGRDFYYLSRTQDAEEIEALRESGRVYQTTINALLFTQAGYDALIDFLEDDPER